MRAFCPIHTLEGWWINNTVGTIQSLCSVFSLGLYAVPLPSVSICPSNDFTFNFQLHDIFFHTILSSLLSPAAHSRGSWTWRSAWGGKSNIIAYHRGQMFSKVMGNLVRKSHWISWEIQHFPKRNWKTESWKTGVPYQLHAERYKMCLLFLFLSYIISLLSSF